MSRRIYISMLLLSYILAFFAVGLNSCRAQETSEPSEKTLTAAVNIVLDCSGSMGLKDVLSSSDDEARRGDVCRQVVGQAVESLKGSKVGVGLVLFGHRSYWKLSDDGTYSVQLSAIGKKQELNVTEIDPSFDVSQEIALDAATDQQIQRIKEVLSAIEFRRGAQSPSVQAVDKAVAELGSLPDSVESRNVILVTDGVNQLADEESAARDTTIEALTEKIKGAGPEQEAKPRARLHVILFGNVFKTDDAGKYISEETNTWVEAVSKLVKETGGVLTTAQDADSLSDALSSVMAGVDSRKSGEITGEIRKNGRLIGTSGEFKVMLMEGEDSRAEPVVSEEGKFRFQNVPTGRKYSIKVTGRIRNRLFEAEVKDVIARSGNNPSPVKVDLE